MRRLLLFSFFPFFSFLLSQQNFVDSTLTFSNYENSLKDTIPASQFYNGSTWQIKGNRISNLPFRGVENILSLHPEYVIQDGEAHLRGSRPGEMGYYLEGMSVRDPVSGALHDLLIDEAIEKISVEPGYFSVAYGNAVAGIIRQQMRTGGDVFSAGIKYRGEPVKAGTDLGGSNASGYQNVTFTMDGPLFLKGLHFFFVHEYQYQEDSNPRFYSPFSFTNQVAVNDWSGKNDTIDVIWDGRIAPKNDLHRNRTNGNISYANSDFDGRISFAYMQSNQHENFAPIYTLLNSRGGYVINTEHFISGNFKYKFNRRGIIRMNLGYWQSSAENNDDIFGNQYWNWYNADKNAEKGIDPLSLYHDRNVYIHGFRFLHNQAPLYENYFKQKIETVSFSFGSKWNYNRHITLNAGMDYLTHSIRKYSIWATGFNFLPESFSDEDYGRILQVNNFGYDVYGDESNRGLDAPKKPVFGGLGFAVNYDKNGIKINAGIRLDYIDAGVRLLKNPSNPWTVNGIFTEDTYTDADPETFLDPRFSFRFPLGDNFRIFTNYGLFHQLSRGSERYIGNSAMSRSYTAGIFIRYPVNPIDTKAIKSKNFEAGIAGKINSNLSITTSYFNHFTENQSAPGLTITEPFSTVRPFYILTGKSFSVVNGLNLRVNLRVLREFSLTTDYTYSNTKGLYSNEYDGIGLFVQNTNAPTVLNPLNYSRKHRGRIFFNLKFNEERGLILGNLGIFAIYQFSSGHPYTLMYMGHTPGWPSEISAYLENDGRFLQPANSVNQETTQFKQTFNLRIDKDFQLGDFLSLKMFLDVENLFNQKFDENVYLFSGSSSRDNFLNSSSSQWESSIAQYGQAFADYYREINLKNAGTYNRILNKEMWNTPRQFRLGIELLY